MTENDTTEHKYTNKLINENSPYLLSHAHNPVDWYPWGEEAFAKAKELDRPIFLSIGYSSCHWCHVMERESFKNEQIAAIMNANYISIKVDREQRPDLDDIYMAFTTAISGGGGWPMSVFLTPDLKPFYAGTYFPPDDRYGRPGFRKVLTEIAAAWTDQRDNIVTQSETIFDKVSVRLQASMPRQLLDSNLVKRGAQQLMRGFDNVYGGFGSSPKFPHAPELSLFLRYYEKTKDEAYLKATEKALQAMADGGIYDQVGGGFSRYSTDARWLVPHFEKMLYDNALLVQTYADAYRITKNERFFDIIRGTLDFVLREMTDESGGFYSALDADSEGEEGKFYIWSRDEIQKVLGDEAGEFMKYYNVTTGGNFEGHNILNITASSAKVKEASTLSEDEFEQMLQRGREKLLDLRKSRIRPLTDDKVLTSWNGLMLSAFCKGYQVTGESRYLDAAIKNATFIHNKLYSDGQLIHSYRKGRFSEGRFLEDYGFYLVGLIDLYQTDKSDNKDLWLEMALQIAEVGIGLFQEEDGTFYQREDGHSDLIVRPKDDNDGAIPSSSSMFITGLLKLERLTDNRSFGTHAESGLKALSGMIGQNPGGMTSALFALDYLSGNKVEIILVGSSTTGDEMLNEIYSRFMPNALIAFSSDSDSKSPLFEGRKVPEDGTIAFVCINSVCRLPVSSVEALTTQLDDL